MTSTTASPCFLFTNTPHCPTVLRRRRRLAIQIPLTADDTESNISATTNIDPSSTTRTYAMTNSIAFSPCTRQRTPIQILRQNNALLLTFVTCLAQFLIPRFPSFVGAQLQPTDSNQLSPPPLLFRRYEIPEGQMVRIICTMHDYDTPETAGGNMPDNLENKEKFEAWETADGTPIRGNGERGMYTSSNILTIREVQQSHAGVYFCRSSRGRRAYVLAPVAKKATTTQHDDSSLYAKTTTTLDNKSIIHDVLRRGETGELECWLATPWRWLRNGVEINVTPDDTVSASGGDSTSGQTYRILRKGLFKQPTTLLIYNVQPQPDGHAEDVYTCQTPSGTVQADFRIRVVDASQFRLLDTSESKQPPQFSAKDLNLNVNNSPSTTVKSNYAKEAVKPKEQNGPSDSYDRAVADQQRNGQIDSNTDGATAVFIGPNAGLWAFTGIAAFFYWRLFGYIL